MKVLNTQRTLKKGDIYMAKPHRLRSISAGGPGTKTQEQSAVIVCGSRTSRTGVTSAQLPPSKPCLPRSHHLLPVTSHLIPPDGLNCSSVLSPQDLLISDTPSDSTRLHFTNLCSLGPIKLTVGFTSSLSQRLQGDHHIANTWLWDFQTER